MKIQIRQSCYETNSSSQHSLVVTKDSKYYSQGEIDKEFRLLKWSNGVWNIYEFDMNFGRTPFRIISGFMDKWLYMCAALMQEYKDNIYNELEKLAFKYVKGLTEIILPEVDDIYCEDYGKLSKFLKEKELSLEEFLTNKKYIIIQDGDEYCYWDDAKDSGLINKDIIDYEYEF